MIKTHTIHIDSVSWNTYDPQYDVSCNKDLYKSEGYALETIQLCPPSSTTEEKKVGTRTDEHGNPTSFDSNGMFIGDAIFGNVTCNYSGKLILIYKRMPLYETLND